ncbi:MAG: ABC transporter permease subunit [Clostridia bacterium]|nr:ABC transporter permease subunit [Clostridia bacterium]
MRAIFQHRAVRHLAAALFWIGLWQVAAMSVGQRILLASPIETILSLISLLPRFDFWSSILFSLRGILCGYWLAVMIGLLLAAVTSRQKVLMELFRPLLAAMRSVPVASFVIAALIWIPSKRLNILISFLIVLPVIYAGALDGIRQIDTSLIEMARIFHMPFLNRLRYIVLSASLPSIHSAMRLGMGLAWKSGVAAEVIGIPTGSIGERLYRAKVYLATPELFAWTLTIIALSALCERILSLIFNWVQRFALGRSAQRD